MPNITFIDAAGQAHDIDAPAGYSLMEIATAHGIAGIVGECGGNLVCTTCHLYVDPGWRERLDPPSAAELDMLECVAAEQLPQSRLGCQVRLGDEHEGLIVSSAPYQF